MQREKDLAGPYLKGACEQCGSCLVRTETGACAWCGKPRRSAKEPAVVDGPLREGDLIVSRNGGTKARIGKFISITSFELLNPTTGKKIGSVKTAKEASWWSRDVDLPTPSEAQQTPGETKRVHKNLRDLYDERIDRSDALTEVERQCALVARLDFDLRMLKLLGRGYSRRDLEAEMARNRKGAGS